jgi:O-6-methylguanine DNA methyltransferase
LTTALIQTADGTFTAYFSGSGLAGLDFPTGQTASRPTPDPSQEGSSFARTWANEIAASNELSAPWSSWLHLTERALRQALAGKTPDRLPPLDLSSGTEFQRRVWDALRKIPSGQTKSYAQVAQSIDRPGAVRAVGQACGANPIPVLIPCHRVLAAGGKLGGFSSGLDWKRKLLTREGAIPESD